MQIVQNVKGEYAIRKRSFFFQWMYLDLKGSHYWRYQYDTWFYDCWGTLEQVEKFKFDEGFPYKIIKNL